MKRLLLSGAAVVALTASPVLAADFTVPDVMPMVEPVIAPPAFSWTSFYIGAQVGGIFDLDRDLPGCGDLESYDFDPITPLRGESPATAPYDYSSSEISEIECTSSSESFDGKGVFDGKIDAFDAFDIFDDDDDDDDVFLVAGGHVGADVQYGAFVIGALIDANWVDDNEQTSTFAFDPDSGVSGSGTYDGLELLGAVALSGSGGGETNEEGTPLQIHSNSESLEWYGTGRVRAGVALGAQRRFLVYGTGGVSFGEVETSSSRLLVYTPDEADRVFDPPAGVVLPNNPGGGSAGGDDEYHPGNDQTGPIESPFLPENCQDGPSFDPGQGLQTAVTCFDSSSDEEFRVGFAAGGGVDFLATNNFSLGVEGLYVNLGDGGGSDDDDDDDDDDLDFFTVMLKGSLRLGHGMLGQ